MCVCVCVCVYEQAREKFHNLDLLYTIQGSGWWLHEICYGKFVRQVHEVHALYVQNKTLIFCHQILLPS